jgi:hypothetical protein
VVLEINKMNLFAAWIGILNIKYQPKIFGDKVLYIDTMIELQALMKAWEENHEKIFSYHCKNPKWKSEANEMGIAFNVTMNCFRTVVPLMNVAENTL